MKMTGLVIKSPWIELILSGKKTWEIRGRTTKPKQGIALIKSKSGSIIGRCDIADCIGPLSIEELRKYRDKHQIPLDQLDSLPYPKTYAWVVSNAKLFTPISYRHPSGAVIWVTLDKGNVDQFDKLVGEIGRTGDSQSSQPVRNITTKPPEKAIQKRKHVIPSFKPTSKMSDEFCQSFSILLRDGSEVYPFRMRDKNTGKKSFKVSGGGNKNLEAVQISDESQLRHYIEKLGYRVRCKSLDGKRTGLFQAVRIVNRA